MKLKNFKIVPFILAGFALLALNGCDGTTGTTSDTGISATSITTFENNTSTTIFQGINTSELNVTNAVMSITKVTVSLDITGVCISDLILNLESPLGTTVLLSDRNGACSNDYNNTTFDDNATIMISAASAPFSGSFIPEFPLADLNTENANGLWKLIIEDECCSENNILNSWSITIE